MKKEPLFYFVIGVAVLLFAAGFLLSQYIEYKQLQLSQEKAIQDCIEKAVGKTTGFIAAVEGQKCRDKFSK